MSATQKELFIKELAKFLAHNQAGKSIELQMSASNPCPSPLTNWPKAWGELRNRTNLNGYPTVEEAEESLKEFLK